MVRSIQHFRRILQKDASSSRKCKEKCLFFPSPIPRQSFAANQLSTFTEQTNRQTRVKTSLVELMDPAGRRKGLTRRRNVNHAWSPLKKEKKRKKELLALLLLSAPCDIHGGQGQSLLRHQSLKGWQPNTATSPFILSTKPVWLEAVVHKGVGKVQHEKGERLVFKALAAICQIPKRPVWYFLLTEILFFRRLINPHKKLLVINEIG